MGTWIDYARLMRIPNVFTAIADSAMGYLLLGGPTDDPGRLAGCVITSSLMYSAGMVLNDFFDLELDRIERPERPLPSGKIAPAAALRLGLSLLVVGTVLGNLAGAMPGRWLSSAGLLALVLANLILYYNRRLKSTLLAPVGMGACRAVNVWMAATIGAASQGVDALPDMPPVHLIVAGIGLYVAGITWFARDEAQMSQRKTLWLSSGVMLAGLLLVTCFPYAAQGAWFDRLVIQPRSAWPLLPAVLALVPAYRWLLAIQDPEPRRVRAAVKQSIMFLIVLDAAVVLALHGMIPSMLILGLLLPATFLGQRFAST